MCLLIYAGFKIKPCLWKGPLESITPYCTKTKRILNCSGRLRSEFTSRWSKVISREIPSQMMMFTKYDKNPSRPAGVKEWTPQGVQYWEVFVANSGQNLLIDIGQVQKLCHVTCASDHLCQIWTENTQDYICRSAETKKIAMIFLFSWLNDVEGFGKGKINYTRHTLLC